MEPDEISVVLQRAADLHTKINDAIERALKSEFLLTSAGKTPPDRGRDRDREPEDSNVSLAEESNAEAKSLGGIRDALEALEDQLESLQDLQRQQSIDRDTALAELEESRRILLGRLRNHRGKEWDIIHEALAFAGEPMEQDKVDLARITEAGEVDQEQEQGGGGDREIFKSMIANFLGIPIKLGIDFGRFASRLFGPGIGVTSRAAIAVAGVLTTVILFSEIGSRSERRNNRRFSEDSIAIPPPPPPPPPRAPPVTEDRCPPGKVMIFQDGVAKCVVKERIEVPFRGEVSSPDVLYGRG